MNLKEEILYNSGIDNESFLVEGIVFFKTSTKLTSLIKKIERKAKKGTDVVGVEKVLKQMKDIRDQFLKIEQAYANKLESKDKLKKDYDLLTLKYSALLNILKDSTTIKILKGLGLAAVIAVSIIGVSTFISDLGIMQNLSLKALLDPTIPNVDPTAKKIAQGISDFRSRNIEDLGLADQMKSKKKTWEAISEFYRKANLANGSTLDQVDKINKTGNMVLSGAGAALTTGAGALLIKSTGKIYKESAMFKKTKDVLKELEKVD